MKLKFPNMLYQSKDDVVLKQTRQKKNVIYGAQAMNKQLPFYMRRYTDDWDIYSRNKKSDAVDLEHQLDKRAHGDYYYTKRLPVYNKEVYSVIDRETGQKIADFSEMPNQKGFYKVISGVRYQTLASMKQRHKEIIQDPSLKFRHEKSRDDLRRIQYFEQHIRNHQPMPISELMNKTFAIKRIHI